MENDEHRQVEIELNTITRALAGDEAALAQIYDVYARPVYRYHYSRVGNAPDAEDLTSQTFMAVIEALPRYQHRGRFTAWMFQIARNKAMDHFRRNHNVSDVTESVADASQADALEAIYQNESRAQLKALLSNLDNDERELIRLRFTAELSFVQIGQLLGRSEDAVRKSIRRILDRLAVQMEAQHA
jgi:RNA polymerase sigma-70 factor (ECF subfamily)